MRGTTFSPRKTEVSYIGRTDLNGDGMWSVDWRATRRETGLMVLDLIFAVGPNDQKVNLKAYTDSIRITPAGETLTLENHDLELLRGGYDDLREQLIKCVRELAPEIVKWLNEMG